MSVKKLLAIVFLCLFSGNAHANNTITYKCEFDRENYEYIINWHQYEYNDLTLKNRNTQKLFFKDELKHSADITVMNGETSYNLKGFKNNQSHLEHYLVFLDGADFLYAYISATKFDTGKPVYWEITSFDNAFDKVTKGSCREFK
jgi:hypothetical protein